MGLDVPRAVRVLAELEDKAGDSLQALRHARNAVEMLDDRARPAVHRNPSDAIAILTTWAELESRVDPRNARRAMDEARHRGRSLFGDGNALKELDARLAIVGSIWADEPGQNNKHLRALDDLERTAVSSDTQAAIAEARLNSLRSMNKESEAIDYIVQGISNGTLPVSVVSADWVGEAVARAGRQNELLAVVIKHLGTDGSFSDIVSHLIGGRPNKARNSDKDRT